MGKGELTILILFGLFVSIITIILFFVLCAQVIISSMKKKPFPKRLLPISLSGFCIVSSVYVYEMYFFTFDRIERGAVQEGPGPIMSPTGEYTANAYFEPYGGAAGGVNVWVEVTHNERKHENNIIYYSDAKSDISMEWTDEDSIYILNNEPGYPESNRSIELDIGKEIYHDTGLGCQSLLMKDEYEKCWDKEA